METDSKKKDPDSFSLDPENPESAKRPTTIDTQISHGNPLSPMTTSPRLHKIDSFSQDDIRPATQGFDIMSYPPNMRITLGLCKSFNKESKTNKRVDSLLTSLEESMKMTEYFVKKQEKRIDEFFHEVYDFFNKNFMRMAD